MGVLDLRIASLPLRSSVMHPQDKIDWLFLKDQDRLFSMLGY